MTPGWRKLLLIGSVCFVVQSYGQNMPAIGSMAKEADWENLESLLEDGLNPNVVYGDGTTALHWASYHDSLNGTKNLLDAGADVNASTDLGVTPLWLAAENGSVLIT